MFRPPADRAPPDIRDEEEICEVGRILAVLPQDHPARLAHARGEDTRVLSHLVGDAELAKALTEAFLAGYSRLLNRSNHFRP
jgi:hypothetical protein